MYRKSVSNFSKLEMKSGDKIDPVISLKAALARTLARADSPLCFESGKGALQVEVSSLHSLHPVG